MLVITDKAIDCIEYDTIPSSDLTWENSRIRSWLKSFHFKAFSSEERAIIQTTNVSADENPTLTQIRETVLKITCFFSVLPKLKSILLMRMQGHVKLQIMRRPLKMRQIQDTENVFGGCEHPVIRPCMLPSSHMTARCPNMAF